MTRQEAAQKIAEKLNAEFGVDGYVAAADGLFVTLTMANWSSPDQFAVQEWHSDTVKAAKRALRSSQTARTVAKAFGEDARFDLAPVVSSASATPAATTKLPVWKVRQLAREGLISTAGLTEDEITDAVKCGVISMSDAMNRDC